RSYTAAPSASSARNYAESYREQPLCATCCCPFSSADALRDLHSFPTRRSSDLVHLIGMQGDRQTHARQTAVLAMGFTLKQDCSLDRKSTRLNSSHVKSSYAVFCLKKTKLNPRASASLAPSVNTSTRKPADSALV